MGNLTRYHYPNATTTGSYNNTETANSSSSTVHSMGSVDEPSIWAAPNSSIPFEMVDIVDITGAMHSLDFLFLDLEFIFLYERYSWVLVSHIKQRMKF